MDDGEKKLDWEWQDKHQAVGLVVWRRVNEPKKEFCDQSGMDKSPASRDLIIPITKDF